MSEEFYIGYQKIMPPETAAFLRKRIIALSILVAIAALVLVIAQHPFSNGTFEYGVIKTFSGIVHERPYPTLTLDHPDGDQSRYFLVAPGKHGAQDLLLGKDGATVELKGSLIYRDDQSMIEVIPDSITVTSGDFVRYGHATDIGSFILRGEIVDSKCFLGVMKPGNLKPHKSCAIRCISGGITPVLCVRDEKGNALYVMLSGKNGEAINDQVIPYVAEPVEVTGVVERRDDMLVMKISPKDIQRL
jgi:hypothetical protein